jgi:hypothetical protein
VPAWYSVIDGQVVVEQGEIGGLDLPELIRHHNAQAALLMERAAASR